MSNSSKYLIIIAGPTAVGKTDLCVRLAKHFDTEVVSADSRQFYQELAIGTAKPTSEEMQGVKHHFIDSHSIADYYSVGDYERDCLAVLEEIFTRKDVAILTGGSGMFIKIVTDGLDEMPEADLELRESLMKRLETEGLESLSAQLRELDPVYFEEVDQQNPQRIVRALEVCLATGQPFSAFRKKQKKERPFECIRIALERPREELYARIDLRMDLMLAQGLEEEARSALPYREHYALKTVGYKEIYEHWDGQYDRDEMVRLLKRNTRRYAKRQLTWFRNQDDFQWFDPKQEAEIVKYIENVML
ncbi:tRNA (adenosine(37)-N6)-dimethylallyltransferase MiaA [Flectobacillus longus]|uniref:tRNA (adenosine(37)-N6)-dimethylallyltransferase MiaA n=1 Tax=Flectobacillus longus TaxID=2984207 RepID=UPI0024B6B402|nr:tRNA (adenosine(37)-N6)-dimethylallyltransferase MiaA [Flectobacillus longus]MDI9878322.1 tRNA (adenosine(37)-N6)-dimethylallyltransferase MiaA [Flectobacillus longus]